MRHIRRARYPQVLLCLLAAALATGCGEETKPTRQGEAVHPPASGTPTPHGMPRDAIHGMPRDAIHGMPQDAIHGAARGGFHGEPSAAPRWTWTRPDDWADLPPSPTRVAGFALKEDPHTQCTLVVLPGDAGGLTANVNRWRTQMGLEDLADEAVAALPRQPLLGGEAVVVDLAGTYRGMGATPPLPDARMLGLILETPGEALFVKMIGPAAVVEAQRANLLAFASSLAAAPPSAPRSPPVFAWEAPAGWVEEPARPPRMVTFAPGGSRRTQCYLTVLPGDAGGLEANVNLWREQMGLPALAREAIAALPKVPVLGGDGVVVELRGDFRGAGGSTVTDTMMVAVMREREADAVFVKLIGPAAEVEPEKEALLAFCRSLRAPD